MDNSKDQRVDKASLPKGKELPLLIIYDSKKHSLKQVMELTIENYVKEDSLIICTDARRMDELRGMRGMTKECKILDQYSLSGIEAQWLVITADDQRWYFESLSRARNGLAIVLDISADDWYVFIVLLLCFLCLVPVAFHGLNCSNCSMCIMCCNQSRGQSFARTLNVPTGEKH